MPLGVPKVSYRLPGERQVQWVDIYTFLSRERILFLTQDLEDEITNQIIGLFLYLNSEDQDRNIFLYVNSQGGSVTCGLSLVDTVQYVKTDIQTTNVGIAASVAAFVVASGKKGKRLALPYSRFIIHQPEGRSKGQATDVFAEVEEVIRLRRSIGRLYAEFTGQPLTQIAADINRDVFLNSRKACEYGLVDWVSKSTKI